MTNNNPDQQYWTNISPQTSLGGSGGQQPAITSAAIVVLQPAILNTANTRVNPTSNTLEFKNLTTGKYNSLNTEGAVNVESIVINPQD